MFPYNPSMAVQSVTIFMGVLNLTVGIIILVLIVKFERLRTRTNFFIFNLIICASLYEIVQAIAYNIQANLISLKDVNMTIDDICVYVRTKDFSILLMCAFANFLGVEWYLEAHKPTFFEKFNKFYKIGTIVIYVLNLVGFVFSFWQSCKNMPYMVLVSVYLNFLQICIFGIIRLCAEMKTKVRSYSLLTGGLVMLLVVPAFIWRPIVISLHKREYSYFTIWMIHLMEMLFELPIVYIPICVAFVLLNHDRVFKLAFDKFVKRKLLNREEQTELDGPQNEIEIA